MMMVGNGVNSGGWGRLNEGKSNLMGWLGSLRDWESVKKRRACMRQGSVSVGGNWLVMMADIVRS